MGASQLAELITFVLGVLLNGFLVGILLRKRRAVPRLLVLLFAVLLFWYAGNLVDLVLASLVGRHVRWLGVLLDAMKGAGYWLMAPLLVHTLLDFLAKMEERKASRLAAVAVYLPSLVLARGAWLLFGDARVNSLAAMGADASVYFYLQAAYLAVAAACCGVITRKMRLEEGQDFFRLLPWPLLFVAAALVVGERMGALAARETPGPGQVFLFACPLLPALYFLWAVFRWNLLDLEVRNSTLRTFLLVLVCFLYFCAVRTISSQPLQIVLLLLLVLLIEPIRRLASRLFHESWFRDREYSLEVLDRFGRELVSIEGDDVRIERLLLARFAEAFETQTARLYRHGEADPNAQAILRHFDGRDREAMNVLHGGPADIVSAVRALGGRVVLPVGEGEDRLGVLLLGPRRFNRHYGSGELKEARIALQQFCATLRNRRLAGERILAERKAQQAERLSALGLLSASVAHEVKNPLSCIRAISQSMEEELPAGHALRRDLEVIAQEIQRLDRMVREVLAFAQPGADDCGPLDVVPIVRNVIYILQHEARRRGVTIVEEAGRESVTAMASEAGLKGALFNLVLNAVHASPEGKAVRLSVSDGERVRIAVVNEGPGIAPELRERLFEPFASSGGTGLGLAIARERVESFSGRIDVESSAGRTSFTIGLAAPKDPRGALT